MRGLAVPFYFTVRATLDAGSSIRQVMRAKADLPSRRCSLRQSVRDTPALPHCKLIQRFVFNKMLVAVASDATLP